MLRLVIPLLAVLAGAAVAAEVVPPAPAADPQAVDLGGAKIDLRIEPASPAKP